MEPAAGEAAGHRAIMAEIIVVQAITVSWAGRQSFVVEDGAAVLSSPSPVAGPRGVGDGSA